MHVQVVKMKHSGEISVEKSPFNPDGFFLTCREEGVCLTTPTSDSNELLSETPPPLDQPPQHEQHEEEEPPQPKEEEGQHEVPEVSEGNEESEMLSQQVEVQSSNIPPANVEEEPEVKKVKMARRRVVLNVPPPDDDDEEEEKGEGQEGVVVYRKKQPRAMTMATYGSDMSTRAGALRRQSLVMLKQGHTGEKGSRRFRAALKRDSIYEGHPGWESIRKLSVVVG